MQRHAIRSVLAAVSVAAVLCPATRAVSDDTPPAGAKDPCVEMYDRGLDYLLTLQNDGIWSETSELPSVEFTAMSAACLYERPGGMREKDRSTATKAIDFLVSTIDEDGSIPKARAENYTLSVVVMALADSGRADVKPAIARCVARLKSFQVLDEKDRLSHGGIGYGADKRRADLSNTHYTLASLRAAGIKEDDPVFKNAVAFLARCQNRKENETAGEPTEVKDEDGATVVRGNDGGAAYRPGGGGQDAYDERADGTRVVRSYGSATYSLLRCYHLAGLPATDPRVKAAVDWISRNFAVDRNPGMPEDKRLTGLFYMYDAMAKSLCASGIDAITKDGAKIDWRKALSDQLAKTQRSDGSWVNEGDQRYMEGNPVIATSFALLALAATKRTI